MQLKQKENLHMKQICVYVFSEFHLQRNEQNE